MIVCALTPSLGLTAAVLASGLPEPVGPTAVAPSGPGDRAIGEVNTAAGQKGLRTGTDVATALEICPSLVLLPPDPIGMEAAWETVLTSLEGIGAEVEAPKAGEAFFDLEPLIRMYGGQAEALDEVFLAVGGRALIGAGPTRLAAVTTAAPTVEELEIITVEGVGEHLRDLPVDLLRERIPKGRKSRMFETLGRLGIATLGELKSLSTDAVADRFGEVGLEALRIASGLEGPLRPRRPESEIQVFLELDPLGGGNRLPAAIDLACESIASRLERTGVLARSFELEVYLEAGGSLSRKLAPRVPTRSVATISLLAGGAFAPLPSPAESLAIRTSETTPESPGQPELFTDPTAGRRQRIQEAVRQVRAVTGGQALLRIIETDPGSRLPERRVLMVPLTETRS